MKGTSQYIVPIAFPATGKMDGDSDLRAIKEGDIVDALNCRWGIRNDGTVGSVENIKSNLELPINLPDGNNKVVGGCADYENKMAVVFLYNDENRHCILSVNMESNDVSPILWEETILNLDGQYINNPVVLDGILYWTDVNGIRNLIIEKARAYTFTKYNRGIGYWKLEEYVVQP